MIFLIRYLPYESDSRVIRYHTLLKNKKIKSIFLTWGKKNLEKNIIGAKYIPRIRQMPFINLFLYFIFTIWVYTFLIRKSSKGDIVICVDFEARFALEIINYFFKLKLIFDVADPVFLSKLNINSKIIKNFLIKSEEYLIKKSYLNIFPSSQRMNIYSKSLFNSKNFLIIKNIPLFFDYIKNYRVLNSKKLNAKKSFIVFGYFGSLEKKHRLLELFIDAIITSNHDKRIIIGGSGNLENKINKLSKKYPEKILYIGPYDYQKLSKFIKVIDVNVAFYSVEKELHKFIASNKTYEHLYYGKPLITNCGTDLAEFVTKYNTGWLVQEDDRFTETIQKFAFTNREYNIKLNNCINLWENKFSKYWQRDSDIKKLINILRKKNVKFKQ